MNGTIILTIRGMIRKGNCKNIMIYNIKKFNIFNMSSHIDLLGSF